MYKKANKKLKQTAGFQDTISKMYDKSQTQYQTFLRNLQEHVDGLSLTRVKLSEQH